MNSNAQDESKKELAIAISRISELEVLTMWGWIRYVFLGGKVCSTFELLNRYRCLPLIFPRFLKLCSIKQ